MGRRGRPRRLVLSQPSGLLGRQVQDPVPVGDVGDLVGVGEAEPSGCLEDDAVEDVQLRDLQHVLDRTDHLAAPDALTGTPLPRAW
jgi:hypothetical protein